MTTVANFISTATKYLEIYGDHNIFNKWYWVDYTKTYSSDPGTAWCACFVSYVMMKSGLKGKYSASAAAVATQFKRIPVEKESTVKRGDIVVFNWDGRTDLGWCDHVGIVEWCTIGENGLFGTIEGNTGNRDEGQVLRVTRNNNSNYFTAFFRPEFEASSSSSASTATKTATTASTSTATKRLYGIDVSSNQPANICSLVKNDFAIVKMSGNPQGYSWNYVNPYAQQQAMEAYKKHGCLGLYHFTWGKDANTEADFFVEQVKKLGYLNKAMLVIDYEAQALDLGASWVKKFADRVKVKAGYSPVIYASGGVIIQQNLFSLGYPIWCANYYKGYAGIEGYDTSGMKIYSGCEKSILWQFTSQGYLSGYGSPLDMNVFFGSKEDWKKYTGAKTTSKSTSTQKTNSPAEKKPEQKTNSTTAKKSIDTLVSEVLAGKWGNGADRKTKLTKAGYSYDKVQEAVNKKLNKKAKTVDQLANEVIAGKWGNGDEREERLEAAGYSYEDVQERVNELMNG